MALPDPAEKPAEWPPKQDNDHLGTRDRKLMFVCGITSHELFTQIFLIHHSNHRHRKFPRSQQCLAPLHSMPSCSVQVYHCTIRCRNGIKENLYHHCRLRSPWLHIFHIPNPCSTSAYCATLYIG